MGITVWLEGGDELNQVVRGQHRTPVDAEAQRQIDSKRLNHDE
jgi:hypothetical protein